MPPCQVEQPQRHSSELSSASTSSTTAMMNPISQKKTSSSKTSKASSAAAAAVAATTNDSYLNTNVGIGRRSSNANIYTNTNSVGNNQATMNFPGNFDPHHLGNDNSPMMMMMMSDADATAVAAGSSSGGVSNTEQSSLFYRQLKHQQQQQQQQQQQMMMLNNRNTNMMMMSSMAGVATDRRGSGSTSGMGRMSMMGNNDFNSHKQNNEASAMGGAGAFGGMMNQGSMSNNNPNSNHLMGFGMSTAGMGGFQPNNNSSNAMSNSNAMTRMNFQSMNSGDGFNSQNFTMNRKPSFHQGNNTPEQEEEMLKMQLQMLQARRAAQQQQQQQYLQGQQGHQQRDMEELRRLRQPGNASNESAGGIFGMNHHAADPLEQQGMMRNTVNTNMQFNSGVGMGSMMNRMGGGLGSMNMPMPFHHNRPIADDYLMLTQRHDALTNTMMGMSSSSNPTSQDRIELSSSRYQRLQNHHSGDNTMGSGFTGFGMGPGLELGEEMKGTSSAWDKLDDKTRSSGASGVVTSSTDSKKKKRKKQKKKPADMPRRPLSAYNLFFSEERERILKELDDPDKTEKTSTEKTEEEAADKADESSEAGGKTTKKPQALLRPLLPSEMKRRPHRKTHGKISFRALAAMVGKRWKALPEERKQYYQNLAKEDMVRQKAAMEAYYEKEAEKLVAETEKNDERKGSLKEEDDGPSSKKRQRISASEAESKKAELIV